MRALAQVKSSSPDLGSGKKSGSYTNMTSASAQQWVHGEGWWRHQIRVEAIVPPKSSLCYPVQGATSALEPLLHKRYRPQPPLIKGSLIANRSDEFLYPLLTLMKSD